MCLYFINLGLLVTFVHKQESRSDVVCCCPHHCSLPHKGMGKTFTNLKLLLQYVLRGTTLDMKQEEGGLKSHHVEQNCHDQWVMFVIFRNTIRTVKRGASRGAIVAMVKFNLLEGLPMLIKLSYHHLEDNPSDVNSTSLIFLFYQTVMYWSVKCSIKLPM